MNISTSEIGIEISSDCDGKKEAKYGSIIKIKVTQSG